MSRNSSPPNDLPEDVQEILKLAGKQRNGVPKGLMRCPVCSDWIGRCLWQDPLLWHRGATRVSCRCEANVCTKCGEPIYEYRLGANVYDEAAEQILHVPGMVGAFHRCGKPRIQLPCPIQPFWDEKYSPVLVGFPVQLVYVGVRPRNDNTQKLIVMKSRYSFDPATFFETSNGKEMRYPSQLSSVFYVDVLWEKSSGRWETFKCQGNEVLFHATGKDFEQAMKNTLAAGLHPDEPAK
jgi:hypothetical protein